MDVGFTLFVLLIALLVAGGLALLLVGYIDTLPAAIAHGWRWALLVLLLPVLGPFLFCRGHWPEFARPGRQLLAGTALTGCALVLLYAIGPYFAARIVAGVAG
ncbi:MAG: hypothetical protein N3C59_05485 [Azovibrio sp.]|nr:hypothetical protein [Azovibrio sp.]